MIRCSSCDQRYTCGFYGICMKGEVVQPHHQPQAPEEDRWGDRDEASERRPKRRKKK